MTATPSQPAERALFDQPSRLFVEVTSRCNLRCPMCVKHAGGAAAPEGDMSPEIFAALEPAFPRLDALVLNGIGEPLLFPRLEASIRTAKQAMPAGSWVGFQSNGHLLHADRARSLVAAGLDRIFLSVDATSPELYRAVRGGGTLGHVERALEVLAAAKREQPGSTLEVGAEFVVMRDNMRELPGIVAWLAARGVARLVVSHMLPFASGMADQPVFGINAEASIRFYKDWSTQAKQEGLDLADYFTVLWKYRKTDEEHRLIDFVKRMSAQARQKDIPFHLDNILAGEDLRQAAASFREAEAVAARSGLSLHLPALRPRNDHTCLGVKRGGTFIAWDGLVSPCHFLWRDSRCYFYGREKQVGHKVFGDLTRDSLDAIWNAPQYRKFRADVLARRYPHCPGCNVYPCEDIDRADFENDCYGETVPCGDCLWNMGLLQCMGQDDEDHSLANHNRLPLAPKVAAA